MLRSLVSKRNVISISLVLLALAAMTLALKPRAAQANEEPAFKGTLTVQVAVSQTCAPGDANCNTCINNSGLFIDAQGMSDTSLGPLFVEVLKCLNPNGGRFGTYAGTLTTTAPNGKDSLAWAYSGQNDSPGDFYGFQPFSGELTITGGRENSMAHMEVPVSLPIQGRARRWDPAHSTLPSHLWGWRSIQSTESLNYATTNSVEYRPGRAKS
jgi:hypothetical protein